MLSNLNCNLLQFLINYYINTFICLFFMIMIYFFMIIINKIYFKSMQFDHKDKLIFNI